MAVFTTSALILLAGGTIASTAVYYGSDADEEFDKKVGNNRIKNQTLFGSEKVAAMPYLAMKIMQMLEV